MRNHLVDFIYFVAVAFLIYCWGVTMIDAPDKDEGEDFEACCE